MSLNKSLADITVITKGRYSNKEYSYLIPDEYLDALNINDIVEIKFNNRLIKGIVRKIYTKKLNPKINYSSIIKVMDNVENDMLQYIKKLSDFYINPLGHTIAMYFSDILIQKKHTEFEKTDSSEYFFGKDCRDNLLYNSNNEYLNLIYCPSLISISVLSKYLIDNGVDVLFKQESGGGYELRLLNSIIDKYEGGIILALNTSIYNPNLDQRKMYKHFWDINHYKYTENRKPNFNLIDVSNIQNRFTQHEHKYYGDFPNYKYVKKYEKLNIDTIELDIKYFYGNTIKEGLDSLYTHESKESINKALFNFDFCSEEFVDKIIKNSNFDHSINRYRESSKPSKLNILIEPTISYGKMLDSQKLSRLIRYIYRLIDQGSKLYVISTSYRKILSTLNKSENVNSWLSEEFRFRDNYGPSYSKRIVEILSKEIINDKEIYLNGPLNEEDTGMYKYQLLIDYEDPIDSNIYEKFKKYNYSFIDYF